MPNLANLCKCLVIIFISIPWSRNFAFGKTIYQPHLRRCSLTVVLRRVLHMEQPNALIWGALDYSHMFMSSWWTYSVMHHVTQSRLTSVWQKISQNEQKDFIVRYWESDTGQDSVRCIGSEFLGHATAADLLTYFKYGIRELDRKRLLHGWTQWVWTGSSTLFWHDNAKLRNSRTYEHRQLKSHGNSINCHGKVMELYYQISVGTL